LKATHPFEFLENIMKRLITTIALLGLFTTSATLISKAHAAEANSTTDSVLLENSLEEQQTLRYGDCYFDTYGNLHCW
ncbi:MAG: hypothetical protein AAGB01_08955, partial [Cyanobacteria bacterium P01_F01_bin.42]